MSVFQNLPNLEMNI
nr:unnamed protein product [Callosobruchus analis]